MLDPSRWFERGQGHTGGEINVDGVWIPKFKYDMFVWSPSHESTRIVI